MRRAALVLPLVILTVASGCKAEPEPESAFCAGVPRLALKGRVTDAANILTAEEEAQLSTRLARYEERTKHQMVVATTPDLGGTRVDNFATCLGNRWGIGRKDHDDGVVILVASGDRKMNISTGKGMEKMFSDDKALAVIHQMSPRFEQGDFAGGLSTGIDLIAAQTGDAQ